MRFPEGAARGALALAVLLSVSACATKGDLRNVNDQIRAVSARQDSILSELRRQSSATQDTLRTTSNQLVDIRGEVIRRLQAISDDLDRLAELTGENQRGIAGLRDQMDAARRTRPAMGMVDSAGAMAGGDEFAPSGGTAAAVYEAAIGQYNRGALQTAQMAFNDFLRQFPNDELAPKAHYYLGQIAEQDGDLDGAVEEYASIRELFPADPQVPQALYRIALIRIQQGDEDEARKMLETVINTYPDDLVTDMARNKLREIGGSDR